MSALPVTYTCYSSLNPVSKEYCLDDQGRIKKAAAAQMASGKAIRYTDDFSDLPEHLKKAGSSTAWGYGSWEGEQKKYDLVPKSYTEKHPNKPGVIARTKGFFSYLNRPGILMLDHDPSQYGESFTPDELLSALVKIHPAIAQAAIIIRGSVSAGVHLKGEQPIPGKGFHLYLPVSNAADIPRYGELLCDSLWLNGYGFIALAKNGAMLERCPLDGAVFSPERLDFVGKPIINSDGLTYTQPPIDYRDGGYLDTSTLPDLTPEQQTMIERLKTEAKAKMKGHAGAKQAEWAAGKVQELELCSLSAEVAKQTVDAMLSTECRELPPEWLLQFANGLDTATVQTVLDHPETYDGMALADPIEGIEYGASTAKFYWNDGKPIISSFAHGGMKYRLQKPKTFEKGCLITEDSKGKKRLLIESQARDTLVPGLKPFFAWSSNSQSWYHWQGTHWQANETDENFNQTYHRLLDEGCNALGYKHNYANAIVKLLKEGGKLALPSNSGDGVLPFSNGLLNLKSGVLLQTTRANALTWSLPYSYDAKADCPEIKGFLQSAVNDNAEMVQYLRAWLAAVLHSRADLQKFLYLVGPGGTGKSTFVRLCIALIGCQNTHSTTMDALENNRFELANIYSKRLVVINDASNWGGKIDNLKALTGQDEVRAERKNIQSTPGFQFAGIVVATSNELLNTRDTTSGVERRRSTVRFDNVVPADKKAAWDMRGGENAVLHSELSGLVNWLLQLSPEQVREAIENPPKQARRGEWEAALFNNPVMSWLVEHCAPNKDNIVPIGNKRSNLRGYQGTGFDNFDTELYPSYLQFTVDENIKALGQKRFVRALIDVCQHLKCPIIKKRMPGNGQTAIQGIGLLPANAQRYEWYDHQA